MPERPYEDVRIEGHLIDSLMVPQIMDDVMDLEGEFEILSFDVGRTKTEISTAVFRIYGRDRAHLEELLTAVQEHGAVAVAPEDAMLAPAPADGVFPDEFYSTTNLETYVRLDGEWVRVDQPEMDCGVRVRAARTATGRRCDRAARSPPRTAAASPRPGPRHRAETLPLSDVRRASSSSSAITAFGWCPSTPAREPAVRVHGLGGRAKSPRRRSCTRWRACCAACATRAG